MHNLIIVAEGPGSASEIAKTIERVTSIGTRATVLGHIYKRRKVLLLMIEY